MERCVCVCTLPFFSSNSSIGRAVMLIVNTERISFSLCVSLVQVKNKLNRLLHKES